MKRLWRLSLTVSTATAALVVGLAVASVGNAAEADSSDVRAKPTAAPKPTKPPKTDARTNRWGLTVDAEQGNRNGHHKKSNPTHTVVSTDKNPSARHRLTTPTNAPKQPFRLNISLCGFRGANTPNLTRCLPALEKDLPAEPNQAVVTPSMAVRIRIPRPEDVQWGQVLAESRNVLFPKLQVKVQPAGRTLVNLDTIVYTDESQVYRQTVTVLGFPVDVEAMPMSYTWSFGDGTSVTTTTPGRPYPAKDITHKYMKKAGVRLTLTTNYAARFNVAGTGWQYVEGTVPITGPATALQVREAVPVLVEPGR
jgi:hypothetical protein